MRFLIPPVEPLPSVLSRHGRFNSPSKRTPRVKPPRYQVKLIGDAYEHWLDLGSSTQIVFTRLGGGSYALVVRDSANQCETKVNFEVESTIFENFWFWVIMILYLLGVVAVIFYLLFLYRYQQKLRLLKLREHVARDLHDDMGSQLSSISILSRNVGDDGPPEPRNWPGSLSCASARRPGRSWTR